MVHNLSLAQSKRRKLNTTALLCTGWQVHNFDSSPVLSSVSPDIDQYLFGRMCDLLLHYCVLSITSQRQLRLTELDIECFQARVPLHSGHHRIESEPSQSCSAEDQT